MQIFIRNEEPADIDTIARLTEAAFATEPHSSHNEQFIVNALRQSGQLTISLVAVDGKAIVGHVAVSPVQLSTGDAGWFGLGPISIWPERQRQSIGTMLMNAALTELQRQGGSGCVVLGDPAYYRRFGFKSYPRLVLPGVPPEYFQALSFRDEPPVGTVRYHESFDAIDSSGPNGNL